MDVATDFYRSQIGDDCVINYCYTDKPWKLLLRDVYYFFVYSWALPWILLPIRPCGSGELDELYPSGKNLFCIFIHFVLFVLQLAFLVGCAGLVILPVWMGAAYLAIFAVVNWAFSSMLNGRQSTYNSDPKYAEAKPEHAHEQWIFLNGVAVG